MAQTDLPIVFIFILAVIILFVNYPWGVYFLGAEYYVSNSGSDFNDGLTPSTPWRTINKVNSEFGNSIGLGDNIYFCCGDTFNDAELRIKVGGTISNPMIIGAYGTGNNPLFNYPKSSSYGLIHVHSSNVGNIIIQDFDITSSNYNNNGVAITYENISNITVRGCHIYDISNCGILFRTANGYLIDNCLVHDCVNVCIGITGSNTSYKAQNGEIKNCTTYNSTDGICLHDNPSGGWIGPNHIIRNCINHHHVEDGIDLSSGVNIEVYDCESYQNSNAGIILGHAVDTVFIDGYYAHDENDAGIGIVGATNVTVQNCLIEKARRHSFIVYGRDDITENIIFKNNYIIDRADSIRPLVTCGSYDGGPYTHNLTMEKNIFVSVRTGNTFVLYNCDNTPQNTNSIYRNNLWWRTNGDSEPFGNVAPVGSINFDWWHTNYPTDAFEEPSS